MRGNIFFSLFAILLLVCGLSFAINFTPPTCLTNAQLFGNYFSISNISQTIQCSASNSYYYGVPQAVTNAKVSNPSHMTYSNVGSTLTATNVPIPAAGTGNLTLINPGAGIIIASYGGSTVNEASLTISMIETDGGYNLSNGSASFFVPSGGSFNYTVSGSANNTLFYPIYSSTNFIEFSSASVLTPELTVPYIYSFGGKILRSNFTVQKINTTFSQNNTFRAVLYYQQEQVLPLITYIPGQNAILDFYNSTTGESFLYNNTVTYIYVSNFQQWFTVPAISVTNLNDVQTISIILTSGQQSAGNITAPLIPNKLSCSQSGDIWTINSSWTQVVDHHVSFWNATNFNQTTSSASSFFYEINVTDYPNANYTVNDNLQCVLSNQTSILGLPQIDMTGVSSTFFFLQLMFIASIGLSVFVPFGLIFSIAYNDVFQILEPAQMALLSTVVMIAAVFVNARDLMNLKTIILYSIMLIAILVSIYPTSGRSTDALDALTANFQDVVTTSPINLWDFVAASATFIISLGEFLLNLPSFIGSVMLEPLSQSSPIMASAVAVFVNAVQLGTYAYLAIKLYEVISNRFRDV